MLYKETVSPELLDLTGRFMEDKAFDNFRLVGGTALSLQSGHRISIDIDLFSDQKFDAVALHKHIKDKYAPQQIQSASGIVMARIDGIKVDCIAHQYPWIDKAIHEEGIRMASLLDIAAMKLNAISDSGHRQKDFADMYYLLEKYSLNQIADAYSRKYPDSIGSFAKHSIREFDKLKFDVKIKLVDKRINWQKIKLRLHNAVLHPEKIFTNKPPGKRKGLGL